MKRKEALAVFQSKYLSPTVNLAVVFSPIGSLTAHYITLSGKTVSYDTKDLARWKRVSVDYVHGSFQSTNVCEAERDADLQNEADRLEPGLVTNSLIREGGHEPREFHKLIQNGSIRGEIKKNGILIREGQFEAALEMLEFPERN